MTTALAVIALLLAAVAVVCLVTPVVIGVRAPDDGDVFSIELRHPAFHVETWVSLDQVIRWLARMPEPPPVSGHVLGVPLRERALDSIARKVGAMLARKKGAAKEEGAKADAEVPKLAKPETVPGRFDAAKMHLMAAAPRAAWESLPRFRRAMAIEVFAFDLDYGTGDPATTGTIAGYLWQLAAVLPESSTVRAQAFWLEPTLRVEGEARLLIFPARALWAALCLAFATARGAWKASRRRPDENEKEKDRWPNRMETQAPAAMAPPSSPS